MQKVAIVGGGGFAREVLDILMATNAISPQYDIQGYIDEDRQRWGCVLNGYPVLGGFDWLQGEQNADIRLVFGVGSPAVRRRLVLKAAAHGSRFCNVIHPSAVLTPFVELGEGTVICAGATLTNQIRLGSHVHVNLQCTIGHDCKIDDYCTLAPGVHVSGNVLIETGCDVGTGAAIIQGLTVGEWSVVGAGAVVTRDVPANSTTVGVPARVIKERQPGWQDQ